MLKEFKTTYTSSRVTSTSSSSSSTEVRSTVRTSCRKQLFSPNDIGEEAVFDNPVRRRKGNKPRPTSPLPRPKRKRRRDNAGSVASSDGSTASRQSQHSVPNQNKRARKPRDHKSVHDRAVSRVLGNDAPLEMSQFTKSELCSIIKHMETVFGPLSSVYKRHTKRDKFETWYCFYKNQPEYNEQCVFLSVSGAHLDDPARCRWPEGTWVRKTFGNKPFNGTVKHISKVWRVAVQDKHEDFNESSIKDARKLFLKTNGRRVRGDKRLKYRCPINARVMFKQPSGDYLQGLVTNILTYWRIEYIDGDNEELDEKEMEVHTKEYWDHDKFLDTC